MEEQIYDLRRPRKVFSRIGFAFSVSVAAATLGSLLFALLPVLIWGENDPLRGSSWWKWIPSFAPMYLMAFPACYLVMRRQPVRQPEKKPLTLGQFGVVLCICAFLMYAGNLVGTVLSSLLSGGTAENEIQTFAMDQNWIKILVMVVLAPVFEELVCRKALIDRTIRFGEKNSVLLSGLVFGLLHQNLFQFFYAFAVGCAFALVYMRTGRIRYAIVLHMIINFNGAVIAPLVTPDAGLLEKSLTGSIMYGDLLRLLPFLLYSMVLMGASVFGLVMLIVKRRRLVFKPTCEELPSGTALKTTWLNPGMAVYTLLCLAGIVRALF